MLSASAFFICLFDYPSNAGRYQGFTGLKMDKNIFEATRRKPILPSGHAPDIKSRLYPAPKNEVEAWVRTDRAMDAATKIKKLEALRNWEDQHYIDNKLTRPDLDAVDRGDMALDKTTGRYVPVTHPDKADLARDVSILKALKDPQLANDPRAKLLGDQHLKEMTQKYATNPEHA